MEDLLRIKIGLVRKDSTRDRLIYLALKKEAENNNIKNGRTIRKIRTQVNEVINAEWKKMETKNLERLTRAQKRVEKRYNRENRYADSLKIQEEEKNRVLAQVRYKDEDMNEMMKEDKPQPIPAFGGVEFDEDEEAETTPKICKIPNY